MKVGAWQVAAWGLDGLRYVERALPTPQNDEVLVKISAASLNYRDLLVVRGAYNPRFPLPLVPGSDAVGRVVAVGPNVTRWSVGDRVMGAFAPHWLQGRPDRSMAASAAGGPAPGTFQTHRIYPSHGLVSTPSHLTDIQASTLTCAGVTAWRALVVLGRLRPGETVLVQGTGGVSLFALQIARRVGAEVLVTSRHEHKLEVARTMGATHTIHTPSVESWSKEVLRHTGGQGVDHVVEVGGAGTLEGSLRCVAMGGNIHMIGVLSGASTPLALTRVLMRGIRIQGIFVGSVEDFAGLAHAMEATPHWVPHVHQVYPSWALPQALEDLSRGEHMGKLVLRFGEDDEG